MDVSDPFFASHFQVQKVVLDPEFMFSTRQIRLLERLLCGMLFWYILFPLYAGQKSWHTYLTSG